MATNTNCPVMVDDILELNAAHQPQSQPSLASSATAASSSSSSSSSASSTIIPGLGIPAPGIGNDFGVIGSSISNVGGGGGVSASGRANDHKRIQSPLIIMNNNNRIPYPFGHQTSKKEFGGF